MYLDPRDRLRYCWRCRKRIGRGPGRQVCEHCQTYNMAVGTSRNHKPIADIEQRIAYYAALADQELDLFDVSPWRRLPGAEHRLFEAQTKLARAARRIAATDEIE